MRALSEEEIETLANSQAEKEAFMKSTVAFVLTWLAGFLVIGFIPRHFIRYNYVTISFIVAFVAGLITRWIVKESAYKKYYILYKEQQQTRS